VLPAAAPATNPLAALASLAELHVINTSSTIVQGVTQLNSLCMYSDTETLSQLIVRCLHGMQQLQQLDLSGSDDAVPAATVAQLSSAAPHLKGLTLDTIRDPAFEALLMHATQLTHLTCRYLQLSEDRSKTACSWKELVVAGEVCIPQTLAYLPLHSLSRVQLIGTCEQFEIPSTCPCLTFYSDDSTPAEFQAALINLGTCPAWQASGPAVIVGLTSLTQQTVEYHMQIVSALAALANKEVQLLIIAPGLQVTSEHIVDHLGATLGHSLTHLELSSCTIHQGFWPAVCRHLPRLQELSLRSSVVGAVSFNEIEALCSHATRPLRLNLGKSLYSSAGPAEQLEQQCRTLGVPQVTVTELCE
jgi:hypothetical protein